ncbi:phosphotransferase [Micromonospora sp. NBC_00330]|uniref:phosphotransferase n=1 Tax=Micromonospora sp. NBC_00330 TaxID=2903585 RepID=UPI002E2BF627|nr:phosphotransferase [Micromonospora sp. NBC_00330]
MTRSWEQSLDVDDWDRPGVWTHGDPLPGNLLFQHGRLNAVIDFGGLKAGDPPVTCNRHGTRSRGRADSFSGRQWGWTTPPGCGVAAGRCTRR